MRQTEDVVVCRHWLTTAVMRGILIIVALRVNAYLSVRMQVCLFPQPTCELRCHVLSLYIN